MTIKRYSKFGFPFVGPRAELTTTLNPGHGEFLVYCHPDVSGEGILRGIQYLRVIDYDRIKQTIVTKEHVIGGRAEKIVGLLDFPKPTTILEGIEIRGITNEIHGGYTKSGLGEDVVIYHEPTLPQQARK